MNKDNRKQIIDVMEIRNLMRRRRVTQGLLAGKMEVRQQTVSNWLTGKTPITEARKEAMIKAIKEFD